MSKRGKDVKLFFDFEFTGLQSDTTPISLGIASSCGKTFYAEFTDYNKSQVDDWVREHVIDNLTLGEYRKVRTTIGKHTIAKGEHNDVKGALREWVAQFRRVEFWGDCSWYDGVLLNEVLGGASNLPINVNYIFFDIATLLKIKRYDPDTDREQLIDIDVQGTRHNAMYDARVIKAVYFGHVYRADKMV